MSKQAGLRKIQEWKQRRALHRDDCEGRAIRVAVGNRDAGDVRSRRSFAGNILLQVGKSDTQEARRVAVGFSREDHAFDGGHAAHRHGLLQATIASPVFRMHQPRAVLRPWQRVAVRYSAVREAAHQRVGIEADHGTGVYQIRGDEVGEDMLGRVDRQECSPCTCQAVSRGVVRNGRALHVLPHRLSECAYAHGTGCKDTSSECCSLSS